MTDEGIGRDEAVRRFRIEDATTLIEPEAKTRWPASFAGVWIEIKPFAVKVAFTEDAEANVEELRSGFPFPEVLQAATGEEPQTLLEKIQELMIADRTALQAGLPLPGVPEVIRDTAGRYDLDIDLPDGTVVVRVEDETPELLDAFRATYLDRLRVEEGLSVPLACDSYDCRYAMMSGLALNRYDTSGAYRGDCTSAFMTYSKNDFDIRYALSAAHCSFDQQGNETILHRRHVHERYGPANNRKLGGSTDAERIHRDFTPWKDSSKTVVAGELPRDIGSYRTYADMNLGDYIGKTGITTATTRGYVGSKSEALSFVPNSSKFVRASFCVSYGDSGSGVWQQSTAWGIVSSGSAEKPCRHAADFDFPVWQGIFGAIDFALDALNVGLLKGRNIAPRGTFYDVCDYSDCTFYGGFSEDWDGKIVSYSWNFGDGTSGSGSSASKVYTSSGTYEATADLVACSVRLRWTPPTTGLTPDGYDVYRSTSSGGPYSFVKHVSAVTMTTDSGLARGQTYHYVVRSSLRAIRSGNSNQRSATTGLACV